MSSDSDSSSISMGEGPSRRRPKDTLPEGNSGSEADEDQSGSGTDTSELFISSTISRDDTAPQGRQEQDMLSHLDKQSTLGSLRLKSPRDMRGLPTPRRSEKEEIFSPAPTSSIPTPLPPTRMFPPQSNPPPLASTIVPPHTPRPPISVPVPRFKAWKDAEWRRKLQAQRKMSSEASLKMTDVGGNDNSGANGHHHSNEIKKSVETQPPEKKESSERGANLAEDLATMTEKHLGIDVLDQSKEVSTFVSYLLDTIQILERQVRYLGAANPLVDSRSGPGSGPRSGSGGGPRSGLGGGFGIDSKDGEATVSQPQGSQVVHRIFCSAKSHEHDRKLYEDEPVTRRMKTPGHPEWLHAGREISHLETWLSTRPSLCFIIIQEHRCAQDQRGEVYGLKHRIRLQYDGTASGRLEKLRIASPALLKALMQVAEFPLNGGKNDFASEMEAPYLFLFHHRKKLEELSETGAYQDVILPLTKYLRERYEAEYTEAEEMILQGYINAYHIPKLFKPNQMLLMKHKGEPQVAFILQKFTPTRGEIFFEGWRWQFNGHDLQRTSEYGRIRMVPEEKTKIRDLIIYPIEFALEEDVQILSQRGIKFWGMRDKLYTCYTGWDRGSKQKYASARFMIDTATYQIMHGASMLSSSEMPPMYDPWPTRVNRREDLPQKAELLLPATIHGFNLKEKRWVNLFVDNIHEVDWNYRAFDRLVLDVKVKEMIRALVDVQTSAKKMDDIITGKGNGLIILLHGSPGTGKTLTAESVAEIAEKPLYRVTCGDIGINAHEVEKYLETVMYLGKTWDCVLLLDEADVFLEERTMADLQRNSLVSVFLRLLEYYEGILILTSNRVGTFDEAFKSRIQVAIHYDNLTRMSRKAIWQNFFDMIEESAEEDVNMPELERRLDQLASEEMNGRQIRNALLTARQLAKHRKERLDWEHLSQVIKTSAAFNKYLKAVRGHTDEQWARGESLR